MNNLEKLVAAVQYMRQQYPDGGFRIESFEVDGDTATAQIKFGKKKSKKVFTFADGALVGM